MDLRAGTVRKKMQISGTISLHSTLDPAFDATIDELRRLFSTALDSRIAPGSRVAFLEFPYDTNVGNHMMWLAGLAYFAARGVEVVHSTHATGYDAQSLRRAVGDGPIIFNGGVGLSALWPINTALKRRIVREFPNNPLLVFPSTVAFRNNEEQDGVRDLFRGHSNVTVLARDAVSHATIAETFQEVDAVLVPDSAFLLPMQERRRRAEHAITWLVRNDHESTGYTPPQGVHTFDWAGRTLRSGRDFPLSYSAMFLVRAAMRLRKDRVLGPTEGIANRMIDRLCAVVSREMLQSGNVDLDRGRVVVTDRFHTHILAILRKQPVVLLVDAFGKNKNSFATWTHRFPNVRLANTPAEALELARELARDGAA